MSLLRRASLAAALALAGCAGAPAEAPAGPEPAPVAPSVAPLVVGSDLDNPPFAWVDEQNRPQGRDVEMMEAIGHLLHRPVVWKRLPFAELLPAVQRGEVDVVCATLGITPERAELVDFTRPYFVTELAVVTRNNPDAPTSLAQLAGRKVAAGAGTTAERAVRQRLPQAQGVFENEAGLGAAERLASGEVDAVVMDGPAAAALLAENPGLRRMAESLGPERYALVVRRGDQALRPRLDEALEQFELSGSLSRWNEAFGLQPPGAAAGER